MTRRHLLLFAALAVAVLILAGVGFVFRYHVTGWARGEASYKGKYTCEWRAELDGWIVVVDQSNNWLAVPVKGDYTPWEMFLRDNFGIQPARSPLPEVLDGDAEAVPVLLVLLRDQDNRNVRLLAANALGNVGAASKDTTITPLVETVEDDPDPEVKKAAKWALFKIDPKTYSYLVQ